MGGWPRGEAIDHGVDGRVGWCGMLYGHHGGGVQPHKANDFLVWHRLETGEGQAPLAVGTAYFPTAQDAEGHARANVALCGDLAYLTGQGYRVALGGDFNAHTGANGDKMPVDMAGRMLLETADWFGMVVVNTMPNKCIGGPTRVQVRVDGTQESTIDYVMCSSDLAPNVKSMVIDDRQMGSDHRPCVLTLSGMALRKPAEAGKREAWRTDRLPCPPSDWSWVDACRHRFADWTNDTAAFIEAVKAAGDDASKAADVLDWSFQAALDEVAAEHLGTKWVGPRAVPVLDAAGRLAQSHHRLCQDLMHASMRDPAASDQDRREARQDFLQSSRRMLAANARRKRLDELRLFRDVEAKQADSKLFWSRF